VLLVQIRSWRQRDEELTAIRIWTAVCHSQDTSASESELGMYFIFTEQSQSINVDRPEGCDTYNLLPYMLMPPRPVPVGSPVCIIKS
jgi:hypothetical protein